MPRILIIDDDKSLCELLKELLQYEGFNCDVVHDGETGLQTALETAYDLIFLDVMLPGRGGFQVLKALRRENNAPVLMLSARGEPADRVMGLEHGADDYLPKPFTDAELIARVRAILRRTGPVGAPTAKLATDELLYSEEQQQVYWQGKSLELTGAESLILGLLLRNAGDIVSKETLSLEGLGRRLMPFDRSVDMHVSHLRKKLKYRDDFEPIKTIRGKGYLWTLPVSETVECP